MEGQKKPKLRFLQVYVSCCLYIAVQQVQFSMETDLRGDVEKSVQLVHEVEFNLSLNVLSGQLVQTDCPSRL